MRLVIVTFFTLFRVIAAIVIVLFLWPNQLWGAIFLLVSIGFLTDLFDGMLARRWHVVSRFGQIADPLADKIICLAVLWLLVSHYQSIFLLLGAILMTVYDITTMLLRFTTAQNPNPVAAAHFVAKAKTLILMSGLCLLVLNLLVGENSVLFVTGVALVALSCGLAVWSLKQYLSRTVSKQGAEA